METANGVFSMAYDTEVIEGDKSGDKIQKCEAQQLITVPYSKVTVCKRVTTSKKFTNSERYALI